MINHEELLARLDAWLGTGDSDTADFLHDMRDAAARIRELASQLPEGMKHCTILFKKCSKGHGWLTATNWVQHECPTCQLEAERAAIDAETIDNAVAACTLIASTGGSAMHCVEAIRALKPTAATQDNKARASRDEFKAHSSMSLLNTPGPAPAAVIDKS